MGGAELVVVSGGEPRVLMTQVQEQFFSSFLRASSSDLSEAREADIFPLSTLFAEQQGEEK